MTCQNCDQHNEAQERWEHAQRRIDTLLELSADGSWLSPELIRNVTLDKRPRPA